MKKFFSWVLPFVIAISFLAMAASLNQVRAYYFNSSNYKTSCATSKCTQPSPGDCAKNVSCPACGTTNNDCCNGGNAWTRYTADCRLVNSDYGKCNWVWATDVVVCSTGSKCIDGEKGLRAGHCDCSYGGLFKTCCDGNNKAVKCVKAPDSLQDGEDPNEGACPSGSTEKPCSGDTCGTDAACQGGTTSPTPTPTGSSPPPANNPDLTLSCSPSSVDKGDTVTCTVHQKPVNYTNNYCYYCGEDVTVISGPQTGTVCTIGRTSQGSPCTPLSGNTSFYSGNQDLSCNWDTTNWTAGSYTLQVYYGGHTDDTCRDNEKWATSNITVNAPTNTPTPTVTPTVTPTPTNTPSPTPKCDAGSPNTVTIDTSYNSDSGYVDFSWSWAGDSANCSTGVCPEYEGPVGYCNNGTPSSGNYCSASDKIGETVPMLSFTIDVIENAAL